MKLNLAKKKELSAKNIADIVRIGVNFGEKINQISEKCVEDYKEDTLYSPKMLCIYDNYIWECKYSTQGTFDTTKWEKIGDELSLIDLDTIKSMVNLSDEEINSLQNLISTEIRLDKCFSSSDTYNRILTTENECKKFTLEQLAKKAGVVYKVVADTTEVDSTEFLYLISNGSNGYNIYAYIDGSAVKISDANINLDGYAKFSDLNNYYDKATSDGKYATITTVNGKVDKTSILSTISSTPSDDKLLSEKAINDTLVKKTDITTTIDSTSTDTQVPGAKTVYDNCVRIKNLQYSYTGTLTTLEEVIKSILDNTNPQQFKIGVYSGVIASTHTGAGDLGSWVGNYILTVSHNGNYGTNGIINAQEKSFSIQYEANKWFIRRVCSTSVVDVNKTNITYNTGQSNYVALSASGTNFYSVTNGICQCSIYYQANVATAQGSWVNIITGLPKPKNYFFDVIPSYNNSGAVCQVYFLQDGTFEVSGGTNGSVYMHTFSYPVVES